MAGYIYIFNCVFLLNVNHSVIIQYVYCLLLNDSAGTLNLDVSPDSLGLFHISVGESASKRGRR